MKTKEEVREFLNSLQWQRMTKSELNVKMTSFFEKEMKGEEATDMDADYDYSLIYTTGDYNSVDNFVDMEIYYLPTREYATPTNGDGKKRKKDRMLLITGTELLDYVEKHGHITLITH